VDRRHLDLIGNCWNEFYTLKLPASAGTAATKTSATEAAKTASAKASATTGKVAKGTAMATSRSHHAAH
jgi:hypothetical protein